MKDNQGNKEKIAYAPERFEELQEIIRKNRGREPYVTKHPSQIRKVTETLGRQVERSKYYHTEKPPLRRRSIKKAQKYGFRVTGRSPLYRLRYLNRNGEEISGQYRILANELVFVELHTPTGIGGTGGQGWYTSARDGWRRRHGLRILSMPMVESRPYRMGPSVRSGNALSTSIRDSQLLHNPTYANRALHNYRIFRRQTEKLEIDGQGYDNLQQQIVSAIINGGFKNFLWFATGDFITYNQIVLAIKVALTLPDVHFVIRTRYWGLVQRRMQIVHEYRYRGGRIAFPENLRVIVTPEKRYAPIDNVFDAGGGFDDRMKYCWYDSNSATRPRRGLDDNIFTTRQRMAKITNSKFKKEGKIDV